jgi:hypothetical protein
MNHQQATIIFSVFQSEQPIKLNLTYHNELVGYFKQIGIPHIEARGYYKGTEELSLIVPAEYESTVRALTSDYKQETYLYLDSNNLATLHNPEGKLVAVLGRMSEVPNVAGLDAYTEVNGRFFVAGA